jgi:hypothetical protein
MITPAAGATAVQSMVLTTANDFASRDPLTWEIAGTNDAIDHMAANNGTSIIPGVTWTTLGSGDANMPGTLPGGGEGTPANNGRFENSPVLSFANTTAYTSYRILFPTTKDPNGVGADSMQIAEVALYSTLDGPGSGSNIVSIVDGISAFQLPQPQSRFPQAEGPAFALDGMAQTGSASDFPDNEGPTNAVDGTNAKYLNFGEENSGFIVSPASGASTVRSFRILTANDAPNRDPTSWELFGTNSPIMSTQNSHGLGEAWTLVDSGTVDLPLTPRNTLGPVVAVDNTTAYTSYKMLYPTIRNAGATNSMQIGEISFFPNADGSGTDILNAGDPILAIDASPSPETKYLNFGKENSGIIVTPDAGAKVVTGIQLRTANDAPSRDPASYELYGTNSAIVSAENSRGDGEAWTLISSGALDLPMERQTDSALITFINAASYTSYKLVFPTIRDTLAADADSMQIGGVQLFDSSVATDADFNNDNDVDGKDFLIWQRGFGGNGDNSAGDADGNGVINGADLAAWRSAFGAAVVAGKSVPEPHSAAMALTVIAATVCRGARLRR